MGNTTGSQLHVSLIFLLMISTCYAIQQPSPFEIFSYKTLIRNGSPLEYK